MVKTFTIVGWDKDQGRYDVFRSDITDLDAAKSLAKINLLTRICSDGDTYDWVEIISGYDTEEETREFLVSEQGSHVVIEAFDKE